MEVETTFYSQLYILGLAQGSVVWQVPNNCLTKCIKCPEKDESMILHRSTEKGQI